MLVAMIEHEAQLHHMGDERHGTHRLQHVDRPQLDGLIDSDERCSCHKVEKYKCHRLLPNDPV